MLVCCMLYLYRFWFCDFLPNIYFMKFTIIIYLYVLSISIIRIEYVYTIYIFVWYVKFVWNRTWFTVSLAFPQNIIKFKVFGLVFISFFLHLALSLFLFLYSMLFISNNSLLLLLLLKYISFYTIYSMQHLLTIICIIRYTKFIYRLTKISDISVIVINIYYTKHKYILFH